MSNRTKPSSPKATCSVKDCDRLPDTRGMCGKHYQQALKGKIPLGPKQESPDGCLIAGSLTAQEGSASPTTYKRGDKIC